LKYSFAQQFSHILGCTLEKFSIKYLNISLHWKALSREIWMDLINKIQSRLQIWKGRFLSLDGKVVLLNSVLTSKPLYYLSLYKIPSWCLLKIDKIKRSFLWTGADKGSHRHVVLIHWFIVCTPKQYGGLCLLNLKYMNRALLLKWWWRFSVDSAHLWKLVVSLVPVMHINLKRLVGSGKSILFWFDVWFGEVPFYILFSNLFAKAKTPGVITVAQVWNNGNVKIPLTKGASLLLRWEKSEVISILSSLSDNFRGQDSAVWSLTPPGVYTVQWIYLFFMHTGFSNTNLLYL
jgi:hypothetical protein